MAIFYVVSLQRYSSQQGPLHATFRGCTCLQLRGALSPSPPTYHKRNCAYFSNTNEPIEHQHDDASFTCHCGPGTSSATIRNIVDIHKIFVTRQDSLFWSLANIQILLLTVIDILQKLLQRLSLTQVKSREVFIT